MLRPFQDKAPRVHETAFVEESAHVIGDVELGAHSSVWFQCVIRADACCSSRRGRFNAIT